MRFYFDRQVFGGLQRVLRNRGRIGPAAELEAVPHAVAVSPFPDESRPRAVRGVLLAGRAEEDDARMVFSGYEVLRFAWTWRVLVLGVWKDGGTGLAIRSQAHDRSLVGCCCVSFCIHCGA